MSELVFSAPRKPEFGSEQRTKKDALLHVADVCGVAGGGVSR